MNPQVALLILKVLGIVGAGLKLAPELKQRKDEYIAQIEAMVQEGRGPTQDEIGALLAEGEALSAAISEERDTRYSRTDFVD